MSEHLKGSVGIVKGGARKAPGNRMADQQVVIRLLSKIPTAQGGMKEEWGNPPNAAVDGMCAPALGDAIWKFQSFWKANGTFKNIDGVVDPNGNTLRVLHTLVMGAEVKAAGPNSLPPANTTNLNKVIEALRGAFPRASPYTLTNAPGFAVGIEVGVGLGVTGGQLDVKKDGAAAEEYLTYAAGSAEMGISPAGPVTFTASTRDMRSATSLPGLSGMGRIYTRQASLTLEDMTGPMGIFGITGASPDKFFSDIVDAMGIGQKMLMGASFNVFFLGITPSGKDALTRLPQTGNIFAGLMNVAKDCKAVCMSAGEVVGFDLSVGFSVGMATSYFNKITAPDWYTENQPKAKNAYDDAEKQVKDTLNKAADDAWNKIKDWTPF